MNHKPDDRREAALHSMRREIRDEAIDKKIKIITKR